VVAQTKERLHDKTFLADIAEQFGLALGGTTGLRNADNDLTLSQAGTQVHAISQVFTGGVYDILADVFALERNPAFEDDAAVLHRVAAWLRGLVLRALVAAPEIAATYADVVNEMLRLAVEDGKPAPYIEAIRHQFTIREVVGAEVPETTPVPAPAPVATASATAAPCTFKRLSAVVCDAPGAQQDRRACCGTMNLAEYYNIERVLDTEAQALARWCAERGRNGPAGEELPVESPPSGDTQAAAAIEAVASAS